MEDRSAISRIKQGDLNGLETLVNRYQVRAVHVAYLIVYERALAEDIVQTAFVKVAERVQQFDEQRSFALLRSGLVISPPRVSVPAER